MEDFVVIGVFVIVGFAVLLCILACNDKKEDVESMEQR